MSTVEPADLASPPEEEVPLYDPALHLDPTQVVRVDAWCACGAALRQIDPVAYVVNQLGTFQERHTGDGHGPVSALDALDERETRREAAFVAAGDRAGYEPKEHPDVDGQAPVRDWTAPLPDPEQLAAAAPGDETTEG